MLWAKLLHDLGQLEVHVILNPLSRLFLGGGVLAHDFGADGTLRWECLGDGFRLKADHRLGDHRVEDAGCAVPRLSALLNLKAKKLQSGDIRLLPLLAGVLVIVNVAGQITDQQGHRALWQKLSEVGIKIINAWLTLLDTDLKISNANVDLFRVNDLNLNGLLFSGLQSHW